MKQTITKHSLEVELRKIGFSIEKCIKEGLGLPDYRILGVGNTKRVVFNLDSVITFISSLHREIIIEIANRLEKK